MPKITKDVKRTVSQLIGYECSRCGKQYGLEDPLETQEFLHWNTVGGYGSVWGDGNVVEVDLCQSCTYDLFDGIATIYEN